MSTNALPTELEWLVTSRKAAYMGYSTQPFAFVLSQVEAIVETGNLSRLAQHAQGMLMKAANRYGYPFDEWEWPYCDAQCAERTGRLPVPTRVEEAEIVEYWEQHPVPHVPVAGEVYVQRALL